MNATYRSHRLLQARAREMSELRALVRTAQDKFNQTALTALQKTQQAGKELKRVENQVNFVCLFLLVAVCLTVMTLIAFDMHSHLVTP